MSEEGAVRDGSDIREGDVIYIKNWWEHQHYKDKRPPWIKLYVALMEDPEFVALDECDQIRLLKLWLISVKLDGSYRLATAKLSRSLGMPRHSYTLATLARLKAKGFISKEDIRGTRKKADSGTKPADQLDGSPEELDGSPEELSGSSEELGCSYGLATAQLSGSSQAKAFVSKEMTPPREQRTEREEKTEENQPAEPEADEAETGEGAPAPKPKGAPDATAPIVIGRLPFQRQAPGLNPGAQCAPRPAPAGKAARKPWTEDVADDQGVVPAADIDRAVRYLFDARCPVEWWKERGRTPSLIKNTARKMVEATPEVIPWEVPPEPAAPPRCKGCPHCCEGIRHVWVKDPPWKEKKVRRLDDCPCLPGNCRE